MALRRQAHGVSVSHLNCPPGMMSTLPLRRFGKRFNVSSSGRRRRINFGNLIELDSANLLSDYSIGHESIDRGVILALLSAFPVTGKWVQTRVAHFVRSTNLV